MIVIVLASNLTGLGVSAFEKEGAATEQIRMQTSAEDSGVIFNKIDSISKESKSISVENDQVRKSPASVRKGKDYVEGEILVKYKKNKINLETFSGRSTALNFIRSKSLEKKEDLRKINISVLRIKDSKTVEQKIAELKNDPNIEYVEPNYKRYPAVIMPTTPREGFWGG